MPRAIAAILKALEPNGAKMSEPKPVTATMGLALVLNPSFRETSIPGICWPVSVIRNSGSATEISAFSENSGKVKTGAANSSFRPDRSTRPCVSRQASPSTQNADHRITGGEALQCDVGDGQKPDEQRIDACAAECAVPVAGLPCMLRTFDDHLKRPSKS
ncbi:hypothetical protein ASD02_35170 [Ensifer sp. Root1252]|nr:hypothetical protein ASD02_35170 [Ensifer sp. Root1252]KQY67983.1 hypothetical protein ASD52_33635 [Ensifer sp. Root142]KRC68348.1 hypothetical protein ASE32_35400 [Ensifer sp. Root231]KRC93731.1 hypothetical protein ASE47_35250 [Ensifer sp. Root258]